MGEAFAFLIAAATAILATAFAVGAWAFRERALRRQREVYEKALAARDRRIYDLKAQVELLHDLADVRLAERYAAAKRGLEAHIAALEEERDAWTREQAAIEKRLGEIAPPPSVASAPASTPPPTPAAPDPGALDADRRAVALEVSRLRAEREQCRIEADRVARALEIARATGPFLDALLGFPPPDAGEVRSVEDRLAEWRRALARARPGSDPFREILRAVAWEGTGPGTGPR
jgi:hypothetical protein